MAQKVFRVQGDGGPPITFQLEGVDVTGWTSRAVIRRKQGDPIILVGAVTNGPTGDFSFPFAATDLDVAGQHRVDIELTDTAAVIQTHPQKDSLVLVVREQTD